MARHITANDCTITASDDAGHSASLSYYQSDLAISGVKIDGKEQVVLESQGVWTGTRGGARAYPGISFSGRLKYGSMDDFRKLVMGLTTDFVSTADDISDKPHVDLTITWSHDGSTFIVTGDDCCFDEQSLNDGDGVNVPYACEVRAAYTENGQTIISGR